MTSAIMKLNFDFKIKLNDKRQMENCKEASEMKRNEACNKRMQSNNQFTRPGVVVNHDSLEILTSPVMKTLA